MRQEVSEAITFRSKQISRMFDVSLRQLQWWDEGHAVTPRREGHARAYTAEDATVVGALSELRKKGVSLQRCRKLLRTVLKKELSTLDRMDTNVFFITPHPVSPNPNVFGKLALSADHAVVFMEQAKMPMVLIDLGRVMRCIRDESKKSAERRKRQRRGQ